MDPLFSDRITDVPRSFIREILKVAISKDLISFAGGLPNRELFPVEELQKATLKVFETCAREALQYSNSEGYEELRKYISNRYMMKKGLIIPFENILITTGSQQGMDLLGKTFINEKDDIIIEEPGYLGAIQAFSVYRATFHPVRLNENGLDIPIFEQILNTRKIKFIYTNPNFQNPSGISYSKENRVQIADLIKNRNVFLVEDDPYGELRFSGEEKPSFMQLVPEHTILLGSFSKTAVPSFRIGWIVAPPSIMDKLLVAKQASDLHTNYFVQRILHQYLIDNDIDNHIFNIRIHYGRQKNEMIKSIQEHFPSEVKYTNPEGGMFLWVTLPEHISSMKLFDLAIKKNVAFVPGHPFYTRKGDVNTLRLNYTCTDEPTIREGIKRLSESVIEILNSKI